MVVWSTGDISAAKKSTGKCGMGDKNSGVCIIDGDVLHVSMQGVHNMTVGC